MRTWIQVCFGISWTKSQMTEHYRRVAFIPPVELQRLGELMSGHTPEHMQSFADCHLHVVAVN